MLLRPEPDVADVAGRVPPQRQRHQQPVAAGVGARPLLSRRGRQQRNRLPVGAAVRAVPRQLQRNGRSVSVGPAPAAGRNAATTRV